MRRARIISQLAFGLLFLILFLNTRYMGEDVIPYPVNAFFQIDALAALSSMTAARKTITFFWPLLLVIPATLVFGRFFCGWICPMGGTLDLAGRYSRIKSPLPGSRLYPTGQILLFFILVAAFFGFNLSGIFDPLSLLIRSLTMGVINPVERAIHAVFDAGYQAGGAVAAVSEPFYDVLLDHLLSFQLPRFRYAFLFLSLFLLIVVMEFFQRRFWCRNLCPLGAMQGFLSSWAPLGLKINAGKCTASGKCEKSCRMAAIEGEGTRTVRKKDCILCYDCISTCEDDAFTQDMPGAGLLPAEGPFTLSRRQFMAAAGSGVLVPMTLGPLARPDGLGQYLIRPPGAVAEDMFTALCLRCGECMRVCLTNGLQPTLLEAGAEAIWTPRLISRIGYCEYSCTLCGQVCPTGAIEYLDMVAKRKVTIGTAIINRNTCIPFVRPDQCLVCEEHCPTPEKAIVFDDVEVAGPDGKVTLKQPKVVEKLCIGCGICETKCPLDGESAIRIVRNGEDRHAVV